MNRIQKLRALAALEAAAGAIRTALKAEAATAYAEDGMVPSWSSKTGISAGGSITNDRCEIDDPDDFMAWLVEHKPQLVHTVVVPRDPKVVAAFLAELAESGPRPDPKTGKQPPLDAGDAWPNAAEVPGVMFVKGGLFGTLSVRVDSDVKKRLAAWAHAWAELDGTGQLDLAIFERLYE